MYSISILHPSRNRPKQADETIKKWLRKAVNPEQIQYLLSVDKSDKDLRRYTEVSERNGVKLLVGNNRTAIEAINRAAKQSTGNLLIVVSDDFDDPPINWDETLLYFLKDKYDFIVKTQDGIQKTLITLPLMDRCYYNRFGYIYHNSYLHMHSDEEMTCVAHMLGKVIESEIIIPHNHYSTGNNCKDIVNVKNNKTWNQGKNNLKERKKINFGLNTNEIVKNYTDIIWK